MDCIVATRGKLYAKLPERAAGRRGICARDRGAKNCVPENSLDAETAGSPEEKSRAIAHAAREFSAKNEMDFSREKNFRESRHGRE